MDEFVTLDSDSTTIGIKSAFTKIGNALVLSKIVMAMINGELVVQFGL